MEPPSPSAVTQQGVANRELDELHSIERDSDQLSALVADGLAKGTLEETATLERLSELSSRLLTRNRARASAARFGHALMSEKGDATVEVSLDSAASTLLPAYFRHTQQANDGEGGRSSRMREMWVSK